MNNRMLARIVAAVMAIAMLGSISFAASISGDVISVGKTTDAYKAQTQKTAVAYFAAAADAEPAAADIIAIYQADGVAAQLPESIKIDTTKETSSTRNYLVVKYGGSSEAAQTFAIDLETYAKEVAVADTYTIDYGTWTKKFSNVAAFTETINLNTGQTVESYGFKLWKNGGADTSETKPLYFTRDTAFEGGGEYSFGVVMVAVPSDVTLLGKSFYTIK